jgi:hypothetical protein
LRMGPGLGLVCAKPKGKEKEEEAMDPTDCGRSPWVPST